MIKPTDFSEIVKQVMEQVDGKTHAIDKKLRASLRSIDEKIAS